MLVVTRLYSAFPMGKIKAHRWGRVRLLKTAACYDFLFQNQMIDQV